MNYKKWLSDRENKVPGTPQAYYDEEQDIICGGLCEEPEDIDEKE